MKRLSYLLIVLVVLSGCSSIDQAEYCEDIRSSSLSYTCCTDCHKLDYEFLHYEWGTGGIGRTAYKDCYCKDGNEPIQIY